MSTGTRNRTRAPRTGKASAPTLRYLSDLVNQRECSDDLARVTTFLIEVTQRAAEGKVRDDDPDPLSQDQASKLIDNFKDMPRKVAADRITTEGVFEFEGSVYLVTESKAGRLYARVYSDRGGETQVANWHEPRSVKLTYAPGMMGKLREGHRASKDRCNQLSTLTATCVRCGAHLENPESVARGMGPICAAK